jgi:hypothetical protein
MDISLQRAPLYVANVYKHSAVFVSIVEFFLKIIVPT